MHRLRIRVRTLLLIVLVLASGMGAYRSMRIRLDYCREGSVRYDCSGYSLESKAFWDARLRGSLGIGPGWEEIQATKDAAAEDLAIAARFRSAAWRLWLRPPYLPPSSPVPNFPLLQCPEDDGVGLPIDPAMPPPLGRSVESREREPEGRCCITTKSGPSG
jgi:hypothetical protein